MSLLRFLIPLTLLAVVALLVSRTDFHALEMAFSQISGTHALIGLILVQVQIIVSALRWRFTAGRLGEEMPVPLAVSEYYVASFLNQSLPGGMAGDAIRAFRMRQAGSEGWKQPAKAVLFERLSGQMTFFLLAAAGLFFWPFMLASEGAEQRSLALVIGISCVGAALVVGLYLFKRQSAWGLQLSKEISDVFIRDRALVIQSTASVVIVSSYVAVFFLASDAVGAPLPWSAGLTVIPLSLIAMLIPAGLGGWGTREAAAMALWPLIGATSTQGLAASLVYGSLSLAGALPGLAILLLEAFRRRARRA